MGVNFIKKYINLVLSKAKNKFGIAEEIGCKMFLAKLLVKKN